MDRYKGTKPFEDNKFDHLIFFGRDQEKNTLINYILTENLVVLYAASGIGKTSLLNAGLMPLLRTKGFYPIVIRFKKITSKEYSPETQNENNTETPIDVVHSTIEKLPRINGDILEGTKEQGLWNYFESSKFWIGDRSATPVIIFDQFEEFFQRSFSKEDKKQFIKEVADIVQGRYPSEINSLPKVKFLISLREEYLFHLEDLAYQIPSIFHNRYRLTHLNQKQAYQAIVNPAKLINDSFTTPTFTYEDKQVKQILRLRSEENTKIEEILTDDPADIDAFQLQIICQSIEKTVKESNKVRLPIALDKNTIDNILQHHLETTLSSLGFSDRREVREFFKADLISGSQRLKQPTKRNISESAFKTLEREGLLALDKDKSVVYFELTHDNWIDQIKRYEDENSSFISKYQKYIYLAAGFIIGVALWFTA